MARKRLTDQRIRALKFDGERKEYWAPAAEGRGVLGIRVGPRSKTFVFSYRFAGKARRMTLGEFPRMSLAEANAKVGDARHLLDQGQDPGRTGIEARREEQAAETMQQLCLDYLADPKTAAQRTVSEMQRIINHDILPALSNKKAKDVKRRDITRLLDSIVKRGSPIMANRVRAILHRMFAWAVAKGLVESSPVFGTEHPSNERVRERALSAMEIATLWQGISESSMEDRIKRATKLLLVTLQRRSEVVGMHESELDRRAALWTIPASRTKNATEQLVPLTSLALELIGPAPDEKSLKAEPLLGYVFHRMLKDGRIREPFHANALSHAMRDLFHPRKYRGRERRKPLPLAKCRPHDLRRTGATMLREMGLPREDVGLVLNHRDSSVTARHYDKYRGLPEKQRALSRWDGRLRNIIAGRLDSEVLHLPAVGAANANAPASALHLRVDVSAG